MYLFHPDSSFQFLYEEDDGESVDLETFQQWGFGRRRWNAELDLIPSVLPYKKVIQAYLDNLVENVNNGRGLILQGPMGSGKTSIAAIIAKALWSHGGKAFFIKAQDIPALKIEKWSKPYFEGETYEETVAYANILIIDDLGLEVSSARTAPYVEALVRDREERGMSLILTTNQTEEELFAKNYGNLLGVARHICESVSVVGHSWRDS